MFCTRCGMAIGDNRGGFCPQCGAPLSAARGPSPLSYHGTGGELFGLLFVNFLLTLVTLGIYSFWARNRVRQYLTSRFEIEGQRFEYHGTGLELFLGMLKALGLFLVVTLAGIALQFLVGEPAGSLLAGLLFGAAVLALMPMILTGARRYRMSRTSWHGIRFSFRGTTGECARVYYRGLLLTVVTLGFYYPYFMNALMRFMISNTWYGNLKFEYDGEGAPLFSTFVVTLLLAPFTLGISLFWYHAEWERHLARHSSILGTRFQSGVDGPGLLALAVTNALLVLFTLGIAWTWAQTRVLRYHSGRFSSTGPLNTDQARRQAAEASATGEGLDLLFEAEAGFFDIAF